MNKRMSTIETGGKALKHIEERKASASTMGNYGQTTAKSYSKYENNYDFLKPKLQKKE
jgi:hypothetical protein